MPNPKILIAIHYMHLGGAEISLIGLLQALDPQKVDIDLFVYSHEGELMKFIPDYVNLLPEEKPYSMLEKPLVEVCKSGYLCIAMARLYAKFYRKIKGIVDNSGHEFTSLYTVKFLPDIQPDVNYDLAISFLTPHTYVRDKVSAEKKIAWIHTDYTRIKTNVLLETDIWKPFDLITSISCDVTKSFTKIFPFFSDKIIEIENILSPAFVKSRADEFNVDWEQEARAALNSNSFAVGGGNSLIILSIGRFSNQKNFDNLPFICSKLIEEMKLLLSVGRFCEAKNYDNVPDICKRMIDSGCDVKWYIIGFGVDEPLIRQKIAEAGMQEHVIILGKKENPYPYIKACDIYVQPSRYEGKSVTVREAQMLCKPVSVTNYPTANSQIQDGVDGVIVPMDNEGCAKVLAEFILDTEKQNRIIDYLQTHDYGNVDEVDKIYNILGI